MPGLLSTSISNDLSYNQIFSFPDLRLLFWKNHNYATQLLIYFFCVLSDFSDFLIGSSEYLIFPKLLLKLVLPVSDRLWNGLISLLSTLTSMEMKVNLILDAKNMQINH